jgi:hypothetical protein
MSDGRRAPGDWPDVLPAGLPGAAAGKPLNMPLGTSIFLIAVGAILRYAVTTSVEGIELRTVGLILIIVGIVGLLLSILYMAAWAPRRGRVVRDRVIERDPREEPPAV